jgi:hypothetical protein
MKQLEIVKFLKEHPTDWKQILTSDPYNLDIKEKGNLVLFIYSQINSDFNLPIVNECRGLILEKET